MTLPSALSPAGRRPTRTTSSQPSTAAPTGRCSLPHSVCSATPVSPPGGPVGRKHNGPRLSLLPIVAPGTGNAPAGTGCHSRIPTVASDRQPQYSLDSRLTIFRWKYTSSPFSPKRYTKQK